MPKIPNGAKRIAVAESLEKLKPVIKDYFKLSASPVFNKLADGSYLILADGNYLKDYHIFVSRKKYFFCYFLKGGEAE